MSRLFLSLDAIMAALFRALMDGVSGSGGVEGVVLSSDTGVSSK